MAELDNLTLTIKAKSESADKALTNLSQALGRLSNSLSAIDKGGKTTQPFQRIVVHSTKTSNSINNLGNSFSRLNSKLKSFNGGSKNFAQRAGLFYAKCFLMIRGFKQLGRSIESATDYIEQYNYFNTTFQKIASESKNDFAKYGYDNADDYADSFQKRIKEKLGKMTGFNIGDNGVLSSTNMKNLGLDITQMTNYSASVAQLTNSIGLSGEASEVTSQAMAMLAGDMSSFKNIGMEQVMQNFVSGLSGSTMALRKYGVDLSVASLRMTALNYGITKNVTTMSQAEKVQLRMLTILKQSRVAWGDLSKTINSSANQFRVWQNNMHTLSRELGSMFLPLISKVMPYVNAFAIALQRLLGYIASFLGIDLSSIMDESGEGFSDLGDDVLDLSDNMGDATKSAKKLKAQLMGFDNLNVITTPTDSSKNGKDTAPIDLTDELIEAFSDYEKIWNREYEKMQNKAQDFADKLTETFKKAWKSGDGSDIGSAIAKWLNKGIDWLTNIGHTTYNFGQKISNMLATSINSFIATFNFKGFGGAVGDRLSDLLQAKSDFFKKTNWYNLGSKLAESVNAFLSSDFLKNFGSSIAEKFRGAIEGALGFVTTFDFSGLGESLGRGINQFLNDMSEVRMRYTETVEEINGNTITRRNKIGRMSGWEALAKTFTDGIGGLLDTFITAVGTIDWDKLGDSIGELIAGIDIERILAKLGTLAFDVAVGLGKAITKAITKNPIQVAKIALLWGAFSKLAGVKTIATNALSSLSTKMNNIFTSQGVTLSKVVVGIAAGAIAWDFGFDLGKDLGIEIQKKLNGENIDVDANWKISDYSLEEWKQGFSDMWNSDEWKQGIADWLVDINWDEAFEGVISVLNTIASPVVGIYHLLGGAKNVKNTVEIDKNHPLYNTIFPFEKKDDKKTQTNPFKLDTVLNITSKRKDVQNDIDSKFSLNPLKTKSNLVPTGISDFKNKIKSDMAGFKVDIAAKFTVDEIKLKADQLKEQYGYSPITGKKVTTKANGGIFSGGRWHDIAKYASGGLPNKGQYFIARENGPELVGRIGNNTAVMNNDQIVSSVASGVASAVASVIQPMLANNGNNGDIVVQIDGETVFKAVKKQGNMYSKRTGRPAFE